MLEMTCFGNAITLRYNNTLAFQPVGACIASPLCRCCFPVRMMIGAECCAHLRRKENTMSISRVTATLLIMPHHSPRADSGGTPPSVAHAGATLRRSRKTATVSRVTATLLIMPHHSPRADSGGTPHSVAHMGATLRSYSITYPVSGLSGRLSR